MMRSTLCRVPTMQVFFPAFQAVTCCCAATAVAVLLCLMSNEAASTTVRARLGMDGHTLAHISHRGVAPAKAPRPNEVRAAPARAAAHQPGPFQGPLTVGLLAATRRAPSSMHGTEEVVCLGASSRLSPHSLDTA